MPFLKADLLNPMISSKRLQSESIQIVKTQMIEQSERESKNIHYKYILIGLLILLGLIIFKFTRPYMSGFLGAATLYVIFIGQQ